MVGACYLEFPKVFLDEEIKDIIDRESEIYEYDYTICVYSDKAWYSNFEDLEKVLIRKKVPFDRYSEGNYDDENAVVRIYRPEENFDKIFDTDNYGRKIIFTKDVYEIIKGYVDKELSTYDAIVKISSLLKMHDPVLGNVVKPIENYTKDDGHGE